MIIPICKFESIEDKFNFGRYRGLSLADVMDINTSIWIGVLSIVQVSLSNCKMK